MGKQYKWRTATNIISGGYTGEETGVDPPDTGWRTTDVLTGSTTATYYYRDSSTAQNSNSSRVAVSISESWTASISSQNYLTITLSTTINSIVRDDIRGNPWISPYARNRNVYLRREAGGAVLWQALNDPIDSAHTILGSPLALGTYSFTLAPGENLSRGSVYFFSTVPGHESDPLPNIYTDVMWLGTSFQNPLPKDYRPGAALDTNTSIWKSHNRTNGACHILSNVQNVTWTECRTTDGGTGQGNPPLLLHAANANSWYNQKLLGKS